MRCNMKTRVVAPGRPASHLRAVARPGPLRVRAFQDTEAETKKGLEQKRATTSIAVFSSRPYVMNFLKKPLMDSGYKDIHFLEVFVPGRAPQLSMSNLPLLAAAAFSLIE